MPLLLSYELNWLVTLLSEKQIKMMNEGRFDNNDNYKQLT